MMKYSKLWKRCLAGLLCVSMTAASLAGNAVSTYAQAVPASGVPASAVSEESVPAAEDGQEEAVKTPDVQEMPDDAKSRAGVGEQDGADAQRQQSADAAQAAPDGQAAAETDGQDAGGVQAAPDGQAAEQAQDGQKAQDGTGAQAAEPPADTEPSAEEKPGNAQRMARVRAAAAGVLAEDVTALTEDESVDVRISEQGGVQWFSFTPEVSGRYVFASEGDYDTLAYLYADQQGEPLEENDDVSTSNANFALEYALEAGVTYYYAAQMCYDYVTGFFTVSVSYKSKSVAQATVSNPMRTTFYSLFDTEVSARDLVLDVTYTDGTTETVNGSYTSGTGESIRLAHEVKRIYDSSTGRYVLGKGAYAAVVSYMDWEMPVEINVADIDEAPMLGDDLTAEGSLIYRTNYYRMKAPADGYYLASVYLENGASDQYCVSDIFGLNGNQLGTKYAMQYSNSRCSVKVVWLEKDAVYVVNIGNSGRQYGAAYSFSMKAAADLKITEQPVGSGAALYRFVPEEDGVYMFQADQARTEDYYDLRFLAYQEDWSSQVVRTSRNESDTDEEGNWIEHCYMESTVLTAGQAYYVIYLPHYSSEWKLSVRDLSLDELTLGEKVNGTFTKEAPVYRFRAPEDGKYHFKTAAPSGTRSVSYSLYDAGSSSWLTQTSNDYWKENTYYYDVVTDLSAGQDCLIRFNNNTEGQSFELSADKLPGLESVTVSKLPDKTEYVRTGYLNLTGLEITASYADGKSEIISYNGYGSLTGQYFSTDISGVSDGNGRLSVGTHSIGVSYLGMRTEFSVTVKGETAEEVAAYRELTLDQETEEIIGENESRKLQYRFTAPESGFYKLSSMNTQMTVYDSEWNRLEYNTARESNTYIRQCYLEQGRTYVLESMYYEDEGTYKVKIEKAGFGILGEEDTAAGTTEQDDSYIYAGYIPAEDALCSFTLRFTRNNSASVNLYGKDGQISIGSSGNSDNDYSYRRITAELKAGQVYLFRIYLEDADTDYAFGTTYVVTPTDTISLESGKEYPVEIAVEGACQWFSFTPEETGVYCFYSTDYTGDPYVMLYSEKAGLSSPIATDDDGGDSYNFHLDYRMEQGVTYYYKAQMLSDNRTGAYTVHFNSMNQIAEMEILTYPQQVYYSLPSESMDFSNLALKVTYRDGTSEEITYRDNRSGIHRLSVNYSIPTDRGMWAPGEYNVEVTYCEQKLTYPITVLGVPETAEALSSGTPKQGSWNGKDHQVWSFTPQTSGRYLFRSIQKRSEMGLRLFQDVRQLNAEFSYSWNASEYDAEAEENFYTYTREHIYSLEAGVTYYLRGYQINNSVTADERHTYSVEVEPLQKYAVGTALEGTTDASKRVYAEIEVQEEGFYHFESMVTSTSSYHYQQLSFRSSAESLATQSMSYSRSIQTDNGRQYQYSYQYYVYLEPGTYAVEGRSSYGSDSYTISGERVTAWDIQNTVEDTMETDHNTFRGYEITAPSTGAYTFTNRITGYENGSFYLRDKNISSVGTMTSDSTREDGVYITTRTVGADLTAGEKYLLIVNSSIYNNTECSYTLVGQFSPRVVSAEFVRYPQQIYYYKVDQLTKNTNLGMGSIVQLIYEDGKTETINYNSTSKYTGRKYTIEMPEDASYNSSGYLKIGRYNAVFRYLDYTQDIPIQVRSLSAMPAIGLDENGQGSYTGETENACGYGYVRFSGVADGFYNLTLSVDRGGYMDYEKIVNSAYGNMRNYGITSSQTETRYLRNASVYVRQGQSCYIKYLKSTNNSSSGGTGGEFTLSVEKATDRDVMPLTCNEQTEVNITSTALDQWYSFTPEETGDYILNTQGSQYYTYMELYASPDASNSMQSGNSYRNGNDRYMTCSLTAGRTYYFRIYNSSRTGSFYITLVKKAARAVSLALLTEGDIFCSSLPDYIDNSFSDLEFLATYDNGTTEKLTFGYNGTSSRYISLQGQQMSYTQPQWEYDENHEYILDKDYKVTFSYMNASLEIDVTARSIQDLTTAEGTVTATIAAGKYEYYKFVPANTGYYRFDASSAAVTPELEMFDQYMKLIDSQHHNTYSANGVSHRVRVYRLTEGTSYCLRLGNMSSGAAGVSCSSARLSPASSIEVSSYPQRKYYLGVDNQYSTSGLTILVTYEDGTTEQVSAGSYSGTTGLSLTTQLSGNEEGNPYFGTDGTKTIQIQYMDVTTSYTVQVLKNENVPEATPDKPYSGTLSDTKDYVYTKVVAEESGYYQFMLSCTEDMVPYVEAVKNSSYTDIPSWKENYYNDTLVTEDGISTRTKLVYLLAGRTYFMKGRLTKGGAQTSGTYTVSVARIEDLRDGVQTGTLARYGSEVFQYSVEQDGYYQFTLDGGENVGIQLFNSSFNPIRTAEGSRNDRKYYVVKLKADTIYMASCTNSGSASADYSLHAARKAEVDRIEIAHMPDKMLYYSQFETAVLPQGLAITIVYADKTTETLEYGKRSSWGVEMSLDYSGVTRDEKGHFIAGTQTIGCEYLDQKAAFDIEVQNFDISMAQSLDLEKLQALTIPAGASAFYTFTPQAAGSYRFYSRGTAATFGYIYDSVGNMLYSNAAVAPKTDFSITANLAQGNTYILRVRGVSTQEEIRTSIRLHDTAAFTEVTGVNVAPFETVFGTIGESKQLTASVLPEDAQNPSVTWYSSDTGVVTVSESGLLTAVAEGSATVTVTTVDGGYSADCAVIVDTTRPEITHVSPADGSKIGPTARTMWVYAHDNIGVAMLDVEYKKSTDAAYTKHTLMEDGRPDPVILADIPLDGFADGDQVNVRLTAVDKGGIRSEAVTRTYTVDKKAPEIEGLAGAYNKETLAVDLTWTGKMEQDISGYAVYRKNREASDSTYAYLGFVTGYVNKADYKYSDTTVPNKNASYVYKLTANDKLGNSREYTVGVDVERVNQKPEIRLSCASTMVSGREYIFDLSASTDDGRIASFEVNYGDGSELASGTLETSFKHTYTLPDGVTEREYTVVVTATDNEGLTAAETKTIRVVNLADVGMLTVQVTDTDGIPLANAPVYFNMGEDTQVITNTDRTGKAEFTEIPGMYAVGVYVDGYLPVKKYVELAVGETKTLTFTLEEKELVEGTFESHRMTLDEIRDAADKGIIDLENPENHHVIRYEVTLEYATVNIYCGEGGVVGVSGGGDGYKYVPAVVSEEIVVILKIPVKVSLLKEFYSVDLIIINNASEDFSLLENHVSLHVPEGLTVMDGGGANGAEVDIDEIKGQTTETVNWILRGDKAGEYLLSADFAGILSEFNVPVSAEFTSEDPIIVRGVNDLGVSMKIPDQFTNGEFYYSLTMTNTAEVGENAADMYLPGLDGAGELIQTMLMKEDGTKEYISEMPEVLHAGESIERFYRITDQIYEQLQQYPNYKDFVFYFRNMWVEELTNYGVPLDIEVVPAAELAAVYERYRALPATVTSVTAQGAAYGYSQGDVRLFAEATPAENAEYDLTYEWYDTHHDLVGIGKELALAAGLAAGSYHYHCVVVSTRKDNGNKAQTQYQDVVLTITGREAELVWSGDQNLVYSGSPVNVTAVLSNVLEGDTCTVTVTGGRETNAGSYTAAATGLSNSNYTLPQETQHAYTIAPKTVELTWSGAENRTYDGTASHVTAAVQGLVTGDTCSVTVEDGDRVHAGTYTARATGLGNSNYALPEQTSQNYTIEKAALTAAYTDETIYYGTTPALAVSVTGFAGGETAETALQYSAPSVAADTVPRTEGTHSLTPSGGMAADYTFAYTAGSLTIVRRDAAEGVDGQYTVTAPQGTDGWYTADIAITPNAGYAIGDSEEAITGTGMTLTEDTASGTREFYIQNTQTGEIFKLSSLSYKKDAQAPVIGGFAAAPDNTGRQTVTFTVSDALSGIDPESIAVKKGEETVAASIENGVCRFATAGAGAYTVSIKDIAGNTASKELTVSALRFDSKGGSACEAMDLVAGAAYGTLPQTTRAGYEFAGWKDAAGNDATAESVAGEEDVVLTAEWTMIPAKAPTVTAEQTDVQTVYGTAAVLKVTAEPDAGTAYTLEYQWYLVKDGAETAAEGGTGAELTIPGTLAAGSYTYRCRVTAKRDDNQDAADADSEDITVTVAPKTVNLVFGNTQERVYDGTASNITAAVNGLVEGDVCEVTVTGGTEKNAGTHTAEAAVSFADGTEGNYTVTGARSAEYTITPKAAEIVWSVQKERVYDGKASNVTATVTGLVDGDTCNVTVSGGTEKNAGSHTAKAELVFAEGMEGNYTVSGERTAVYTITPKAAEIVWSGNGSRAYDGKASNVTATVNGLVDGDTCNVTVSGGTEKNAGSYEAKAELAFAEGMEGNYTVSGERTAAYTITPKTAEIVWSVQKERVYDGKASNVTASVTGLVSGDTCNVTVTGGTEKNAGSHTAKAELVFAEGTEGNYTVSGGAEASYTITPKAAQIAWSGLEERIYDGKASNVTVSVTGLAEGDTCEVTVIGGSETNAGIYTAKAEPVFAKELAGNYTVTGETEASYTIIQKDVTLIWNGNGNRVYDGTPSNVTAAADGLVEGDTCAVTVTGGNEINAGTYTAAAAPANPNYRFAGGMTTTYTITKAAQTIIAGAQEYTGAAGTKVTIAASASGGALAYTGSDNSIGTVSADGTVSLSKPGKLTVTITAPATENYEAAALNVTVLAVPKAVSVKKVSSPKAKQLKVTWKKDTSVSGYEIQYSLTNKFKKSSKKTWTKNVSSKKSSLTIKKLKGGKKYYVRIRAYQKIDGKKYYGAYGKAKNQKVKK